MVEEKKLDQLRECDSQCTIPLFSRDATKFLEFVWIFRTPQRKILRVYIPIEMEPSFVQIKKSIESTHTVVHKLEQPLAECDVLWIISLF